MYYIDAYLKQIVEGKDPYAPPERYIEYRKGLSENLVEETYVASYSPLRLISFAYSIYENKNMISVKRNSFFKMHNVPTDMALCAYTVPTKWYEEEINKFKKEEQNV